MQEAYVVLTHVSNEFVMDNIRKMMEDLGPSNIYPHNSKYLK